MVGAFFMPGEIWALLCPFLRKEVSAVANRIMGITVEIGGDTTKLQTALKSVNGQIKSTQQQLKDVDKLLKLDPGNTELLAQKQKLLADAVGETKGKLSTLKTAAEQANTALANGDISQEQYDAPQKEIFETEQDLKKLETQANQSATAMPDFMGGLAKGIEKSKGMVAKAVEGVASDMVISPNVRADAATIGNPYLKRGYEEWL